jgi:DNA-binding NarL/FixJ family response regulator
MGAKPRLQKGPDHGKHIPCLFPASHRRSAGGAIRSVFESDKQFQVWGEAINELEAVDKALKLKPDLVVLDYSMPVLNGLEAARMLSMAMPAIPMILYTMYMGEITQAVARAAGFKALVCKSQDIGSLLIQARHLLGLLGGLLAARPAN